MSVCAVSASTNDTVDTILSSQVRAARGLLGWTRDQLVEASQVPKSTLVRFEGGNVAPRNATIAAVRSAFEGAGIKFIAENGGGVGVRMRKPG
jgi:transcriptional regulator with XRE-family HTH domain